MERGHLLEGALTTSSPVTITRPDGRLHLPDQAPQRDDHAQLTGGLNSGRKRHRLDDPCVTASDESGRLHTCADFWLSREFD